MDEEHSFPIPDGFAHAISFVRDKDDLLIVGGKSTVHPLGRSARDAFGEPALETENNITRLLVEEGEESFRYAALTPDGTQLASGSQEVRTQFGADGRPRIQTSATVVELRDARSGEVGRSIDSGMDRS